MATVDSISGEELRKLQHLLSNATSAIHNALVMSRQGVGEEEQADFYFVSIEALLEKAGYLCDKATTVLSGGAGCIGDYDDWRGEINNFEVEAEKAVTA